jgi:peptide/nickel transport system permease protein
MIYALITLNFLLPRMMPGDPIGSLLGSNSAFNFGPQTRIALQKYYGLNGSLLSQYGHYLSRLAHGDLGRSVVTNTSVWSVISRPLPWTLLLIVTSVLISNVIGIAMGIHSGWRRDRPVDRAVMVALVTIWQFPAYLLASILLFLLAVKVHWFPLFGGQTPFSNTFALGHRVLDLADHLVLPLVVLASGMVAWDYLLMRAGMVSELGSDYLLMGRAKGLRERRLKYRYAARNAMLPLVTNAAFDIGVAVTSDIVIEAVFSYPGLGGLLFSSIGTRDYPVIQGVLLILMVGIVTVNALSEVVYGLLDPRTRR